jgi:hypothetical protein
MAKDSTDTTPEIADETTQERSLRLERQVNALRVALHVLAKQVRELALREAAR